jgi:hypothetical protein
VQNPLDRTSARRVAVALALVALVALGAALRVARNGASAWIDGEYANTYDPDTFYHLRRLEYLARNGALLTDDAFAAAPGGLKCAWPNGLEPLTWAADALTGGGDMASRQRTAAAMPVVLAVLAIPLLFAVLRRRWGAGPALAAAAVAAVAPETLYIGHYGRFDHHILELLVFVGLLAVAARPRVWTGALAVGLGLFAVDGAYLALAVLGVAWLLSVRRAPFDPAPFALGALAGGAAATALELALGVERVVGPVTRIGLLVGLLGVAWLRGGRTRPGLGVAAVGAALAAVGVWQTGALLFGTGADPASTVSEAQPIWAIYDPLRAGTRIAVVLAALLFAVRRRDASPFAVAAILGGLLGLLQVKYGYLLVFSAAWVVAQAGSALARPALRWSGAALVLLFVAGTAAAEMADRPTAPRPVDVAFLQVMRALRAGAPDAYAPGARPDGTVLVRTDLGAQTLYLGGRAVTTLPFWSTETSARNLRDTAAALLETDPAEMERRLDALNVRYLLIDDVWPVLPSLARHAGLDPARFMTPDGMPTEAALGTLWASLYVREGAADADGRPALPRLRLLATAGDAQSGSRVLLFERVGGAP